MGDLFDLIDVQVIQGGLLQLDVKNMKTNQSIRMFINPLVFFKKLGESMERTSHEWLDEFHTVLLSEKSDLGTDALKKT